MLTLPEALLLFALHDRKGTIHPPAFLAIDHGLRGASLAELRLRGFLQTKKGGMIRRRPTDTSPGVSFLDDVLGVIDTQPSPSRIDVWLRAIQASIPFLRRHLIERLESAHILGATAKERVLLPNSSLYPMRDESAEALMVVAIRTGIAKGHAISPRTGTLLSLAAACNLLDVILEPSERPEGHRLAEWVAERDGISASVREAVERSEGTWQPA
jgi:golgi phosphoprotein 3